MQCFEKNHISHCSHVFCYFLISWFRLVLIQCMDVICFSFLSFLSIWTFFPNPTYFKIKICDNFRIFSLYDPLDCSPPGSFVHGTVPACILEWVAMPSSRGSSWPRDRILISSIPCIGRQVLYSWHLLGSPMISEFFCYRYSFSHVS